MRQRYLRRRGWRASWPLLLLACILALSQPAVSAQGEQPTPVPTATLETGENADIPLVYIVQEGDTLFSIATEFETTVEVLQQLNNLSDPEFLFVGQALTLPGGGGEAAATVYTLQAGDTLAGLAAAFNTTKEAIIEDNGLLNPNQLAAGRPLTILSRTGSTEPQPITGGAHVVGPGDTPLTVAARYGLSAAAILAENNLSYPAHLYPGQRLRLPGEQPYQDLPGTWRTVRVHPLPAVQGESVAIYVENLLPGMPGGRFGEQTLRFAPYDAGYVAIAGIDAFSEPGLFPLELDGSGEQPWAPFRQDVAVRSADYGTQSITIPEDLSYLLAPEIRAQEDAFLATIYGQFSVSPLWDGLFQMPVTNTTITAGYGGARSYNNGPIEIYHTGTDFAGTVGTPIYAPAAGTVVYSDTLAIRGNTLIVDHGLGIMTGYYHLSKIFVQVGEVVPAGKIIAAGGSTGLSTGPHLHWDLRVLNVPVNGLQWTRELFP